MVIWHATLKATLQWVLILLNCFPWGSTEKKKKMKLSKSPYSLIQNRNNFLSLQINGIFLEMLTVLFYRTEEISMRKFSFVFSDHNINTWAYLRVVIWKHLSVVCYSCGTLLSLLKAFTSKFFFHLKNKFEWRVSLILWMKETEIQRNEVSFTRQHRTMTRFNISSDWNVFWELNCIILWPLA